MRAHIWRDFFAAVASVLRRPDPDAVAAERRAALDLVADQMIRDDKRKPAREG